MLCSKFNSTPILKISSENIENCKSLLGEVNFAITANRDMGNFFHFWQSFRLSIHIAINIKL